MDGNRLRDGAARPLIAAAAVLAASALGLVGWVSAAPLASAVLAEGAIVVEGESKTVQHLEGGIVAGLLVADGDRVEKGAPLITLDTTAAKAERAALTAERDALAARAVRLRAELTGGAPDFSALVSEEPGALSSAVAGQRALFAARAEERGAERAMLDATLTRLKARSAAVAASLDGAGLQIVLTDEGLAAMEDLQNRGVASRAHVRTREQAAVALRGEAAALTSSLAEAKAAEAEAELARAETDSRRISAISEELSTVEARLAEIGPTLVAIREREARSVVRAPVAGAVVGLSVATIGGVVAPGEPIMTIVPDSAVLVAAADVRPGDRERLAEGMAGEIRLGGLETRGEASIVGTLVRISADRLGRPADGGVDGGGGGDGGGEHYRIVVSIDAVPADVSLVPGMPVTVVVPTRTRTAIDYLIAPLRDALARSMREV